MEPPAAAAAAATAAAAAAAPSADGESTSLEPLDSEAAVYAALPEDDVIDETTLEMLTSLGDSDDFFDELIAMYFQEAAQTLDLMRTAAYVLVFFVFLLLFSTGRDFVSRPRLCDMRLVTTEAPCVLHAHDHADRHTHTTTCPPINHCVLSLTTTVSLL
jgi:hypothetical protein